MVERPVGFAQLEAGVHVGEAEHDLGHERHLDPAHHGEVHVAVAHHARADGDGVVARGARPLGREDGAGESEHRARLARGDIGADVGQKERADAVGADALEAKKGFAQAIRTVDGRAHEASRARRNLAVHGQLGMGERILADRDGFEHVGGVPVVTLLGRVEGVAGLVPLRDLPDDHGRARPHGTARQLAKASLVGDRPSPGHLRGCAERGHGGSADDENATIPGCFHTKDLGEREARNRWAADRTGNDGCRGMPGCDSILSHAIGSSRKTCVWRRRR